VELLRPRQLEVAQELAVHGQRDEHALAPLRSLAAVARRQEAGGLGVEQATGLVAGPVEDLGCVQGRGDGRDRVDERLQEHRLRLELVLGGLVASPLRDDQIEREGAEERGRGDEAAGCDRRLPEGEPERADERGADGAPDEDAASVTGEATVHRQPPVVRSVDD
jgi:hypothetical protein